MSFKNLSGDRWSIHCDRPECTASIEGVGRNQHEQQRDSAIVAERKGWQLSHHGADVTTDLCPVHLEPTLAHRMPVTRLYDPYGRALPRQRLA